MGYYIKILGCVPMSPYTPRHPYIAPDTPLKAGANTRNPSFCKTGTYILVYKNRLTLVDVQVSLICSPSCTYTKSQQQ